MKRILEKTTSFFKGKRQDLSPGLVKDQRGINIVETLLIIAILVVLALLVIPNINVFLGTDKKIADANNEALNVRIAAANYFNDEGVYPADSDVLLKKNYIAEPGAYYTINKGTGRILNASVDTIGHIPLKPWKGIEWDMGTDSWVKEK